MIEVAINSIGISPMNYQRVVILKEQAGERYLPIWIGPAEADAIAIKLQSVDVPRPLSHDLLWSVIRSLKASIDSVVINELRDDTFYGRIILNAREGQVEIDSRPSDALALAVRAGAPIFAENTVLDKAGLLIDKETGQATPQETPERKRVSGDELKELSAYTDSSIPLIWKTLTRGHRKNKYHSGRHGLEARRLSSMNKKAYIIFNIATGLFKGSVLLLIILWLLPLWGVNIPVWGIILIVSAFLTYEVVTFRLGRRALERKPVIWSEAMVGRCGKTTTPLTPDGYVQVNGELWHAFSSDTNINEGEDVIVVELDRLTLRVAPLQESKK